MTFFRVLENWYGNTKKLYIPKAILGIERSMLEIPQSPILNPLTRHNNKNLIKQRHVDQETRIEDQIKNHILIPT